MGLGCIGHEVLVVQGSPGAEPGFGFGDYDYHSRARREQLKRFKGLSAESQDQTVGLTVLYVPSLLDCWRAEHLFDNAG